MPEHSNAYAIRCDDVSSMPKRMRAYAALAEEKYNLPTYPVLVNILQESVGFPHTPTPSKKNDPLLKKCNNTQTVKGEGD